MANTRITQGVIKPNEDYDVRHINATGIITAPTGSYALDVHGSANITGTLNIAGSPPATAGDITALAIALG